MIALAGCSGGGGGGGGSPPVTGSVTLGAQCPVGGGSCTIILKGTIHFGDSVIPRGLALLAHSEPVSTHMSFSTRNVSMADGNYSATLAAYGADGTLIASRTVSYYVTDNVAHLSNPSAVQQWVVAHAQNGGTFKTSNFTIPYNVTEPGATSGAVTATAYMANQPEASATSSFRLPHHRPPCKSCRPIANGGGR